MAGEAVVLAQSNGSIRAIQLEHRFVTVPNQMHMRRTVIVGIDDHATGSDAHDRWYKKAASTNPTG